jgi:hypothetical protein
VGILRELEELMNHVLAALLPSFEGQQANEEMKSRPDHW